MFWSIRASASRVRGATTMMCCNRRAEKRFFPAPIEADAAFVCMGFSLQTFPFRHCHVTFRDFASSSWIFRNRTRSALLHTNVPLRVPSATDDEVRPPQRPRARGRPCAAAREYRARVHLAPRASCSRAASATATARGRRPCCRPRRRRRRRRRVKPSPSTPPTPPPWWRTSSSHAPTRISRMSSRRR